MPIKLRTIALISLVTLAFGFYSCLEDHEPRTEAEEMEELNELILSMEADGYNLDTTSLGVFYIVHEPGEGELVVPGDTIGITYDGILTDGSTFDSSSSWAPNGIWEFVYGEENLIPGFQEALSYMNEGAKMEFIIPSRLAYGAYGAGEVGSFQTLIFGVELISHKLVIN